MIIEFQGKTVNFEAISATLLDEFGELFMGLSTADDMVWVSLDDKAPDEISEKARKLVLEHDPSQLSPAQLEQQANAKRLVMLRQSIGKTPLTDAEVEALDEPYRTLARKLAWLELELLALRGSVI